MYNTKYILENGNELYPGYINKEEKKKILLLFQTDKSERIAFNNDMYIPLVVGGDNPVNKEMIYGIINQME